MGALVAILQNDPNLLRCQIHRLGEHVALQAEGRQPEAYGFGYYNANDILLGKRPSGAAGRELSLTEVVGRVDSEALLLHVRTPTIGNLKDENTHPFRFRRWLFAHDGTVEQFAQVKPLLLDALPEFLRRNISGETDSEHLFMYFLKLLRDDGKLDDLDLDAVAAGQALTRTIRQVDAWCRECGSQRPSALNLAATNGRILMATRRGAPLSYALLEGIVPCDLDHIGAGTPESDPRMRPHRQVKAVCLASHLRTPNGFVEVPEGSVVSVSRTLQVTVGQLG